MNLTDILRSQGGIEAIASQLGISPADAERGAGALLPAILHGMGQQATPEGATASGGGLADILTQLGGGALATNVIAPEPTEIDKGNSILGQIFGSKDVSRQVAGHAAQTSGLDPALLKKMLPILAMLVAGYMAHAGGAQQGEQNGGGIGGMLGSVLGSVLGGGAAAAPASTGMGGMLGSLLGMATGSGSSNALDEIIGMAGKLTQR